MACEQCGTIVTYGKRKRTKRRLCIDCWKDKGEPYRPDDGEKDSK